MGNRARLDERGQGAAIEHAAPPLSPFTSRCAPAACRGRVHAHSPGRVKTRTPDFGTEPLFQPPERDTQADLQRGRSDFPGRHIIVESIVAQCTSAPSFRTQTSAMQILSVLPDRSTLARAMSSSPSAGASRFILYSTVRTEESAGISV